MKVNYFIFYYITKSSYVIFLFVELSDSDNYSPICSDNEESETLPPHGDDYAASDPEDLYKKAGTTSLFLNSPVIHLMHPY